MFGGAPYCSLSAGSVGLNAKKRVPAARAARIVAIPLPGLVR
jgi:hypothetical protein